MSTHPAEEQDAVPHWSSLLPFVAVALAVNVLVWRRLLGVDAWYYDQQRIIQLVSILLVAVAVGWSPTRLTVPWGRLPRVARWSIFVVFGLGVASAARSSFPHAAFREVGLFALLVVTALVVAEERRKYGVAFDRIALLLFVVTAMLYGLAFLTMDGLFALRLMGSRANVMWGFDSMWGFDNPRLFGQVGYWMFPPLVAAVPLVGGPVRSRRILSAVVVLWGALIIESGTRAAVYALLAGGLSVLLVQGRSGYRWLREGGLVAGGSLAVWFAIYGSVGGSSSLTRLIESGVDDSGRFPLWTDALDLAARHPFLGVGPEHYAHTPGTQLGSPHNVPLQLMAEWGTPVAAIVIGLAAWGAWSWLGGLRRQGDVDRDDETLLATGLGVALIAGGVASMVDGAVTTPLGGTLLAITSGWMMGMHVVGRPLPASAGQRASARIACLAAGTALLIGALPYATRPAAEVERFRAEHRGEMLIPRFWLIGRLAPAGDPSPEHTVDVGQAPDGPVVGSGTPTERDP